MRRACRVVWVAILGACIYNPRELEEPPASSPCQTNRDCPEACIDGSCVAFAARGQACDETADCDGELLCRDAICREGNGASCVANSDCVEVCVAGLCAPRSGQDGPCDDTADCIAALECEAGTCIEPPDCGNGVLDPDEDCDDDNRIDGDGCDSNCTSTGCGNGIQTAGEQCDDGNVTDGDGCSSTCLFEHCVNDLLDADETGVDCGGSCGVCPTTDFGNDYQASRMVWMPDGFLYVLDLNRLVRVNPDSGRRTFFRTVTCGSSGMVKETTTTFLLLCQSMLMRVDSGTGAVTVVSEDATHPGPPLTGSHVQGPAVDPAGNIYVVIASSTWETESVVQVDPASGERTIWADATLGIGEFPNAYHGARPGWAEGALYLFGNAEVVRVDPTTRDRAPVTRSGDTRNGFLGTTDTLHVAADGSFYVVFQYSPWWIGHQTGQVDASVRRVVVTATIASYTNVSGIREDRTAPVWIGGGTTFVYPRQVATDGVGSVWVIDSNIPGVVAVDPVDGARTVLGERRRGSGFSFSEPDILTAGLDGTIFVADFETHQHNGHKAIIRVHPTTGDRALVTANYLGSGPYFDYYDEVPVGMTTPDGEHLYLQTDNLGTLAEYIVELSTGIRTYGSSLGPYDDPTRAIDGNSTYRVEPTRVVLESGGNQVVSGEGVGAGIEPRELRGIVTLSPGKLIVSDIQLNILIEIDVATGNRTLFSGVANL